MSRKSKWHDTMIERWADRHRPKKSRSKKSKPLIYSDYQNDVRRALCWSSGHDDDHGIRHDKENG